uniref:Uncharacterized protein n=1 Tax=Oryza punctata TaxID=4537 RepID=A0A0E0MDT0_ORYPU
MAEVGGMLTAAVVKMVGDRIGSAINGQIKLQWDFNDDLEYMKMTLESVLALLMDAERQSIKSEAVRLWLKRLKGAAYDISDMIDEFEANTTTKTAAPKCVTTICCFTLWPKIKMANKMKEVKVQLEMITKQHSDFNFRTLRSSSVQDVLSANRATSPEVEEADIVGRTKQKHKIVADLSNKILTQDFIILAIYGMGGIGKTTLARIIFNDNQFKGYTPVWAYVSQVFDLNKIESSINSQLSERVPKTTDLKMTPPNILIVLDDIWEEYGEAYHNLKVKLKAISKGAKMIVIVTTRNEGIAKKFSNVEPYMLEPLEDDMCWKILKQKSAFENRNDIEQLEQTGREIARKCGGVPLAAQSLGYMLHSKRLDEWESVNNSDIWNESTSKDTSLSTDVLASLKLSYVRMRTSLKMCFGYCAVFPKGQNIVKDDLIHQWICLDFMEKSNVYSPKQLGENYVTELLGMAFLQHSKLPYTDGVRHETVTLFTMHDLVHDLASWVMADEILVTSKKDNNGESSYRYALLEDSSKPLNSFMKYPSKIRTLCFVDCAKIGLHYDAFSGAKYLRVLDLSECFVQKLPDSISQLRQLRYLSAPGIQDTMIPDCITKLSKLRYLNLHGSSRLCSLPESIGEMDCLMHLDLSGCSGIKRVPQSFGKLKLSYLDLSNCSSLKGGVSEFLGNLTKLQHLNLSYCQCVEKLGNLGSLTELQYFHFSCTCLPGVLETDVLGAFTKLEYLNLSTEFDDIEIKRLPEAMGSFIKLKYLNLSGWKKLEELPRSWGNLQNLMHLDLSLCCEINGVPEALGSLTKLQYLNLSWCSSGCLKNQSPLRGIEEAVAKLTELQNLYLSRCLDTLIDGEIEPEVVCQNFFASVCSLSNLEELDLSHNYCIRTLPESIGDLRKLHTLTLRRCPFLYQLPRVMGEMESLKHLNISECNRLDMSTVPKSDGNLTLLPQFAVQTCNGESNSNLVMLQKLDITTELEISKLENVINVEEAQRVRLKEKKTISELTLCWTRDVRRSVEDRDLLRELEPPRDLWKFELQGYTSVAFPDWLMNIAPHHFPRLSRIDLVDLPNCTCLPPLGQLPSLRILSLKGMNGITKIDGEFCGGAGAFPVLEDLYISNMESLEEWQTKYSCGEGKGVRQFMFPKLNILIIRHCPKLSLKPCPPKNGFYMEIESSDKVISSCLIGACDSTSNSASVEKIVVKSCKLPLHQWRMLRQLQSSILVIYSCSDLGNSSLKQLKASRGFMRQLTSLTSLTLRECESIVFLPEWLGDLPSLRRLWIDGCPSLKNLQGIMDAHLTSFELLRVESCKRISALPETLGELTSLKKLIIYSCSGIKSLPDSIHKLTNLETLQVYDCPELKKWCESEENKTRFSDVLNERVYCDFIILAIYGMGGIGKTTLARIIFNDNQFKGYTPVWVYAVPKTTDLEMTPPNILLVLDDIWEEYGEAYHNLKVKLKAISKGAKMIVIVTTRNEGIAKKFSNVEPYTLEPLEDDMCWKILNKKLEQTGREIARKCGGVPLAAQSLGYMLHSKRLDEWESVNNSDIWNESTSKDTSLSTDVLASLKLSYVRMRTSLKICFGYCVVFPKGQNIVKDDLIHQWICLDFMEKSNTAGVHRENVTLFTMHDLVHDLASWVMADEILVSGKKDNNGESSYRYALLEYSSKPLNSFMKYPNKIRALCFVDCAKTGLHYDAFSGAKYLRVLDLSECFVQKLPNSIGQLRQLRYLSAPGLQDTMVPDCITKLSKLLYLNLSGSSELFSLPESIGEMDSLMHLDLSGCSGIQRVPQSFGKLKLSYLDLSNCSSLKGVSEFLGNLTKLQHLNLSYCQCVEKLGNLGSLTELQYFHFSSTCLPGVSETDVLGAFTKLEYLDLSTEFDDIKIKRLPEAMGSFIKLKYLNLSGWRKLEELPRSWGNLQNLMHLDLSKCSMIKVQVLDGGSGSNLVLLQNVNRATELAISKLENVVTVEETQRVRLKEKEMISELMLNWTRDARRIVEDQDLLGELEPPRMLEWFKLQGYNSVAFPDWLMNIAPHHFPGLSRIDLVDLPKCTCLPPLGQLPRLRNLSLEGMNGITKIDGDFCGGAGAFRSLESFSISNMKSLVEWQTKYSCCEVGDVSEFMFPILNTLKIYHCPKLSLKPCPPNKVDRVEIESSDNVVSSWPVGACASSSSSVSVKTMVVKSCKLPLHQWRMLHQLPPRSALVIESCSVLGSSSPEITRALSSLKQLTLNRNEDMPELPNWVGEFTCLEYLEIISTRCLELKASRGVTRRLTSLTWLRLRHCESIVSLPEWLGDLPSLRGLQIQSCPRLNNLQGYMDGRLSSLELLHVESCERIFSALPESLGELTSLKELHIIDCSGIKSLPDSIHKLTNLKILEVFECPELKKWCESEENKTKFSDVLNEQSQNLRIARRNQIVVISNSFCQIQYYHSVLLPRLLPCFTRSFCCKK